jgi:hypothetical protein
MLKANTIYDPYVNGLEQIHWEFLWGRPGVSYVWNISSRFLYFYRLYQIGLLYYNLILQSS